MAEHLRLMGDLTPSEICGPMETFLTDLCSQRRALTIQIPGTTEPSRWIGAEEASLYEAAFSPSAVNETEARESIVRRYLRTHALIGLADLTTRYPIAPAQASDLLERWSEDGKVVRVGESDTPELARWAERETLAEMRRATVAVRRGESLAVAPEVFADFLLRRQYVHPATRGEGPAVVEMVLEKLQAFSAPAPIWENEILPRRVAGYRHAWLDEVIGQGAWLWRGEGTTRDDPRIAFFRRDFDGLPDHASDSMELSADAQQISAVLDRHGASFATDLARLATIEPTRARRALRELMNLGMVTNDRFDPARAGSEETLRALSDAASARRAGVSLRARPRRSLSARPEGRWSRLLGSGCDTEARTLAWISVLLERYGILTREVVTLEPSAPSWSEIAPFLSRSEWRGQIRRGYFVEGLSGVQYAEADAALDLARLAAQPNEADPLVLLCTIDPANLYGAGAPLDIELLEGGVARLPRSPGNYLALRAGRPVLIIESNGKRLTGLAWARQADIDSALNLLLALTGPDRRVLKVETYNGISVLDSRVASRLAELGFVRDYPGMTYYAGWTADSSRS